MANPDAISATISLVGAQGISDFAIDSTTGDIWTLDYSATASIRRFDITGALQDSFDLSLDGLDAGITYADGNLYYYDWVNGASTLTTYSVVSVPEPSSSILLALGGLSLISRRKRS